MIRKFHITLLTMAAALVLLAGCRGGLGAELDAPHLVPGVAVEAMLSIDTRAFRTVVSRANEVQESKIASLAVLVFDEEGTLKSRQLIDAVDASAPIAVRAVSGRSMRVVAVANYTSVEGLGAQLSTLTDYPGLTALVVTWNSARSHELLMTGETTTLITENTPLKITLRYAVAKVTLRVAVSDRFPTDETLEIRGVEIGSLPIAGGLLATEGDLAYNARQPLAMQGNTQDGLEGKCYMLENLSGGRTAIAAPATSEAENTTNGHLFKRHYAPANASYAVIHAMHRSGNTTRQVQFYVYFGRDNAADYNVGRSEHHLYTVNIHGLTRIEVDTNVESETFEFNVSLGNNTPMDAHADTRAVYVDASSGLVDVEVISGADWLSVSPLDLQQHQVRQAGNVWQQNGATGSFMRPKHQPKQGIVSFAESIYALCRGISAMPAAEKKPLYVHATENRSSSVRTAQVKVTCHTSSGTTQSQLLTLVQRSAVDLGDGLVMEWGEEYAIESYKDAPAQLKAHSGMQWGYTKKMLYSNSDRFFNGAFATANAVYGTGEEGWQKNEHFVQPDANRRPTWDASIAYRTKYASGQNGRIEVTEPYTPLAVEAPYYTPDYTQWEPAYSPVYGSSAARYCHEKNRDTDGDGVLSPSETEWYLPSLGELSHIWVVWNGIDQAARPEASTEWGQTYWSTSEQDGSNVSSFSFASGASKADDKKDPRRVRCIRRNAAAVVGGVDAVQNVDGMVVVNNSALPSGAWSSAVKVSAPASKESNAQLAERFVVAKRDILPAGNERGIKWHTAMGLPADYEWTLSGDRKATEQTGCAAYTEQPNGSDIGQWRLPTARELVRLWTLSYAIGGVAPKEFESMNGNSYWSASENQNHDAGYMPFEAAPKTFFNNVPRSYTLSVRCVRELK